ncbi:eCIS core domain-containing protein [Actinoplanes sp. CA-142083]|uniref:eCIS core domain-containing protein n=1 Tax=Actinoplanes sp. CA-142083 TaxID=3239903 RepID=UPI003D8ACE4F
MVSDPDGASGLRVLGAASLPPGNVPDPTGAVTAGSAVGHPIGPAGDSSASVMGRTPRERWESAVAARPLEAPQALPTAFHAMASAITGRARPPLFTTGPNTRHALAAAGALGATTGTTVHLPAVPTSGPAVSEVLAHELTHTRSPVRRPRFLLGGMSGLLDDDERQALAAGREALGQGASGLASSAMSQASTAGAGIVDSLPVGGGLGAVNEVATRAARAAVIEAAGSPMGSAFSGMAGSAQDAFSGLQGMAGNAMSGLQSAAGDAVSGLQGAAGDAIEGAASAVSDAAGGVSNVVGGLTGGGAAGAGKPLDPDQVVEIVERRLLREIERRGGRWAGIF